MRHASVPAHIIAALATLFCVGHPPASVADDTHPPRPAEVPSGKDVQCAGQGCETTVRLNYVMTERETKCAPQRVHPCANPNTTEEASQVNHLVVTWYPNAQCVSTLPPFTPEPCGGCQFEHLKVFWYAYARSVFTVPCSESVLVTTFEVDDHGLKTRTERIMTGTKLAHGDWSLENFGQYARDCCACSADARAWGNGDYFDDSPGVPGPVSKNPPVTTPTDGGLPANIGEPWPTWSMPTRCTSDACTCNGTVSYSAANSLGTTPVEHPIWDREGGVEGWEYVGVWRPKMKIATKSAVTSVTATWSVSVPDKLQCKTNPHGPGWNSHHKACPCDFEAVPTGTATRTWRREAAPVGIPETIYPPKQLKTPEFELPGGVKVPGMGANQHAVVDVDFSIHYGPWNNGTEETGFNGPAKDICHCVPYALTPADTAANPPITDPTVFTEPDHPTPAEKEKFKEKEKNRPSMGEITPVDR